MQLSVRVCVISSMRGKHSHIWSIVLTCSAIMILYVTCSAIMILYFTCSAIMILYVTCSAMMILRVTCSAIMIWYVACSWYSLAIFHFKFQFLYVVNVVFVIVYIVPLKCVRCMCVGCSESVSFGIVLAITCKCPVTLSFCLRMRRVCFSWSIVPPGWQKFFVKSNSPSLRNCWRISCS